MFNYKAPSPPKCRVFVCSLNTVLNSQNMFLKSGQSYNTFVHQKLVASTRESNLNVMMNVCLALIYNNNVTCMNYNITHKLYYVYITLNTYIHKCNKLIICIYMHIPYAYA